MAPHRLVGVIVAIGAVVLLAWLARQYTKPPRLLVERTTIGRVPQFVLQKATERDRLRLLPTDLNDDSEPELLVSVGKKAFGTKGWLNRKSEEYTILVSFRKDVEDSITMIRGKLLWTGDYDSDGNAEYVLGNSRGGAIVQFRDDEWHVVEIRHTAPLAGAIAVQQQGKPRLILIYDHGVIEAAQIKR